MSGALRGVATVNFWAADHAAAVSWYAGLLAIDPYFERPGYAEFRVGDSETELGIVDAKFAPAGADTGGGAVVYWHVDDLQGAVADLMARGATEHEPVRDRGNGFLTAAVRDPFGNILGVMTNPHYRELTSRS